MRYLKGKTIWLVGASEGIGEQLALQMAAHGARVVISARNEKKLQGIMQRMEGEGHIVLPLDVTDDGTVRAAWNKILVGKNVPDIVIYNAGAYEPQNVTQLDLERMELILQVNLTGALRVAAKVIPAFIKRKSGHIVLVASVSGYRGLPNAVAYGTSKAGVIHLAECLRTDLKPHGVKVQVVNPGFVKTRLTEKNDFPMPCIITPQAAAREIIRGMQSGRFDIHFPRRFTFWFKLLRLLPYPLYFRIISRITR